VATEEALALQAQAGDNAAWEVLLTQLSPLVRACVNGYFLMGADRDDTLQEGMIGLFRAIRAYQPSRGVPLRAFAIACIRRAVVDAVRAAARQKHLALNQAQSLSDEELQPAAGLETDPEYVLLKQEFYDQLQLQLHPRLSSLEQRILPLFLAGNTYTEIAAQLDLPPKSVDNAIQRIRTKAQGMMEKPMEQ